MILLTDSISQSSNFCWIVLDETTYYISAFAVDSNGTIIDVQSSQITTNFIVPSAYQRVEYIQLTGTQRISPLRLPVDFKFTINAQFDATNQYYNVYDTTEERPMLWVYTNGRFELNIDNMTSANVIDTTKFITVVSDATGTNNILTIDGIQVAQGNKITSITKDTTLLHRGSSDGFKGKISSIVIENWTTKIRELIPCYRKSDTVIGFRDRIGKQFYTNQGSGSFTKGPNV